MSPPIAPAALEITVNEAALDYTVVEELDSDEESPEDSAEGLKEAFRASKRPHTNTREVKAEAADESSPEARTAPAQSEPETIQVLFGENNMWAEKLKY